MPTTTMTREMMKAEYHRRRNKRDEPLWNTSTQPYKNTTFQLQVKRDYCKYPNRRYRLKNGFYVWVPSQYLLADGTIKPDAELDELLKRAAQKQNYHCGKYF